MASDEAPRNIYDDPQFLAGYSTLARFGAGWADAFEHDDLMGLLPDVTGARVLDLGCGAGQLARYLAEAGAAEVIGIDLSTKMLAIATAEYGHPRVTYQRAAIEDVRFPPARFELVTSSLAFHYVEDYAGLTRRIAEWLMPGGMLVFSTEHPIYLAVDPEAAWGRDADGKPAYWALENYGVEGLREQHWFVDGVRKYHRMMATLVNGLVDAGLIVERMIEPVPTDEQLEQHPSWAGERHRPTFVLLRARKP
jgi:2-polyprenyl-3-methyl-5-hydroxy-6-metoxy-1,4-benzoquinol methylase